MSHGLRIYWRTRGGVRRAYADFRSYADVGGKQEALTPLGAPAATSDPDEAEALYLKRLAELKDRRLRGVAGVPQRAPLGEFAKAHLIAKADTQKFTEQWLEAAEKCLTRAAE